MASQKETTVSLTLPASVVSAYDRLGSTIDLPTKDMMQTVLRDFLETEGVDMLDDAQGVSELDRGDYVDLDDVLERAKAIVAAAEDRSRQRTS
jgi:predicted transcriptional regulator